MSHLPSKYGDKECHPHISAIFGICHKSFLPMMLIIVILHPVYFPSTSLKLPSTFRYEALAVRQAGSISLGYPLLPSSFPCL